MNLPMLLSFLLAATPASPADHPEFPLLDPGGAELSTAAEGFSVERTCGPCHDPEDLGPHGPHAQLAADPASCLECHLGARLPAPVDGLFAPAFHAPASTDCGTCHGMVVADPDEAFFYAPDPAQRLTHETGAIFAPGRIPRSGMNVASRDSLARPWDVHAARLVACADCHSPAVTRPRCGACHEAGTGHDFLPADAPHTDVLACEACHIPAQHGPALANVDRTLFDADGGPLRRYQGIEGDPASPKSLVRGYRPVLLPRSDEDGINRLAPYNLVASWAWYEGDREVDEATLRTAFFVDGAPHPSVVAALDATGDGEVSELERGLYSPHQVIALAARLGQVGVIDPQIRGEVRAVPLHHGIAPGKWATRDCGACHGEEAPAKAEFWLADYAPGGVVPVPAGEVPLAGQIALSECGHVIFHPDPAAAGFDLEGTGPGSGPGRILRLGLLIAAALVALFFGTGPMLRSFRRKAPPSEEAP